MGTLRMAWLGRAIVPGSPANSSLRKSAASDAGAFGGVSGGVSGHVQVTHLATHAWFRFAVEMQLDQRITQRTGRLP